jgi:hypothetical protein
VEIPIFEITFTIPLFTAFTYFFSASSAGPGMRSRFTWSWMVSKVRYGFTADAP